MKALRVAALRRKLRSRWRERRRSRKSSENNFNKSGSDNRNNKVAVSKSRSSKKHSFSDGVYQVGTDIQPGNLSNQGGGFARVLLRPTWRL